MNYIKDALTIRVPHNVALFKTICLFETRSTDTALPFFSPLTQACRGGISHALHGNGNRSSGFMCFGEVTDLQTEVNPPLTICFFTSQ